MGYSSQLQKRDGDRSPCPSNSPPNIGSTQKFSVSCGLDRPYSDSDRVIASSLLDCVNLCARSDLVATSGHRCEAVVYEASAAHGAKNCYLKSSAPPSLQQAFVIDSAVAIWPTNNQLDCDDISEDVQAQKGFQKYCGQDYPYNDDVKYNANSLASCVDLCAARGISCAGVSYEASMAHGYHNCYLKSAVGRNNLVTQAFRVDSAFLVRGNAVTSSARATAQNTLSPLGTGPSSSTVTLLTISSSASSGSVTTTPALQIPLASASSPSRVWIAGAVIGPLALLAIAGLLACLCYRRHKRLARTAAPPSYATPPSQPYGYKAPVAETYYQSAPGAHSDLYASAPEGVMAGDRDAHAARYPEQSAAAELADRPVPLRWSEGRVYEAPTSNR